MDLSNLNKYDPSGMHDIYDKWPVIAKESYESMKEAADFKNIDHIIFAGMGGSGTIGDIFSSILSQSNIHVCVVKGYHLPNTIDSNTLVIATSISGNTIETLSVLESACKLDCKIAAFSDGGMMEQSCFKNNISHKKLKSFHSPRASLPSFLYPMISFLGPILNINEKDVIESIRLLENLQKIIKSPNRVDNISLDLAQWMSGTPLIYYPWGLQPTAIRFKNSLQENAKIHAMVEDVIESCHNGIVAWERQSNMQPILIQGRNDYIKTKERWQVLKEYFNTNGINYKEIHSCDGSILSKLIYLIYLLDYSTIYKALLSQIDPSPINSIEFIKDKLKILEK